MCGGARAPAGNTRGSPACAVGRRRCVRAPLGGATEHDDGASPDRPATPTARGPSAPGRADDARVIHAGTLAPRPRRLRSRWRYAKCVVDPPPKRYALCGDSSLSTAWGGPITVTPCCLLAGICSHDVPGDAVVPFRNGAWNASDWCVRPQIWSLDFRPMT